MLFWGILGVIVLRALMIALGTTLVSQFGWVLYIFALFLLLTGYKLLVLTEGAQAILESSRGARPSTAAFWVLVCLAIGLSSHLGMAQTGEGSAVQVSVYLLTGATAYLGNKIAYLTHQEERDLEGTPCLCGCGVICELPTRSTGRTSRCIFRDPATCGGGMVG